MKKYSKLIMMFVFAILCAAGVFLILKDGKQKVENAGIYEELQKEHVSILEQLEPSEAEIPIDFEALKEINRDIYAWIDIEGTNVHYPIVQHPYDDVYYLEHTIEGVKGLPGSIYTEVINSKDFLDFNTLIYGHDMRDQSMFKHLHKFSDKKFFEEHDTVVIYTEDAILKYKIWAAVAYDNRHIMYAFDQDEMEERKEFINSVYQSRSLHNQFRDGVEVDENSQLITLSTCITGQPDKRWIVVCVKQ